MAEDLRTRITADTTGAEEAIRRTEQAMANFVAMVKRSGEEARAGRMTWSDFFAAYTRGTEDTKRLNVEMRKLSGSVYGARRAAMLARTEWRMMHEAGIELMRVFGDIGRIGRNITQMWQTYTMMQMRVEQASRGVQEAQAEVVMRQQELNRLQQQGITTGEEYITAQIALNQATARQEQAQRQLSHAQLENIVGYVGMGFQIMDVVRSLYIMQMHIHMVRFARQAGIVAITAESGALGVNTAVQEAGTLACIKHGIASAGAAIQHGFETAALYAKASAMTVVTALSGPLGWALLATATAVAAGTLAWIAHTRAMQEATEAAYRAEDALTGRSLMQSVQRTTQAVNIGTRAWRGYERVLRSTGATIYFSQNVFEAREGTRDPFEELTDALRRSGLLW